MRVFATLQIAAVLLTYSLQIQAEKPLKPLASFEKAKDVARNTIYADHKEDFYCACTYKPNSTKSGGTISATACGYKARKNPTRGKVLEWEHVVPAYFFGRNRVCWKNGDDRCVTSTGETYKGRECCAKVNATFKRIEADLHNLAPAVGELNGDRSNKPYGVVFGEPRLYGACDFEIGGSLKVTEPREEVKGDAARIWLYMSETYTVKLTAAQMTMFKQWSEEDPPDDWERLRDKRIDAAQGNKNSLVR